VTDLERLFLQLVRNLTSIDPGRLRQPLPLGDIYHSIVPYRAYRRALQLESSEDYELVLMQLCAGEGGFARIEPDEAGTEFAAEIQSPNPDLTIIHRHEKAVICLDPAAVAKALDRNPELAFAPKEHVEPAIRKTDSPERCFRCGAGLPLGRVVKFCPQCGQNLARARCRECKTELEPGWRHCVACGAAVSEG
jgi:hypothetical protein